VFAPPLAEGLVCASYTWETVSWKIFAANGHSALLVLPMIASRQKAPAKPNCKDGHLSTVLNARHSADLELCDLSSLGFFLTAATTGVFIDCAIPRFVTELCGPHRQNGVLAGIGITTTCTTTSALGGQSRLALLLGEIRGHPMLRRGI